MTIFHVPEMSCGHCTSAIDKAVKAVDPGARITFDLPQRSVQVASALDADAVADAIRGAGYDVKPTATTL